MRDHRVSSGVRVFRARARPRAAHGGVAMDGMKLCRRCGEVKPLDEFHNKWSSKDGKSTYCKACANGYLREWRRNNPERTKRHSRTSYQNNIDRRRAESRAYRLRKKASA